MSKACVWIPTVEVDGKEVESRLYKDLLSYTGNRESTKYLWALAQIPEFTSQLKGIKRDGNGEITFDSFNKAINVKDVLDGKTSLVEEKKSLDAINDKGNPIVHKDITNIIDKVIDFNMKDENKELVADVHKVDDGYTISVDYKTPENSEVPNTLMFNNSLNNKLLGIMNRLGFTAKVDDNLTYNGIFNPLDTDNTVDGLRTVIKVAKGERGEEAFPEEFSHFIIEGLVSQPLVERLLNSLNDDAVLQRILGENYEAYKQQYNGDRFMLQKEAAGQLLQSHIIKEDVPVSKNLVSRLWNWVKNRLSRLNESDIDRAIREANEGFAKLASKVKDESILSLLDGVNMLNTKPLYSLGGEVDKLQNIAEQALEVASRRLKIIQSRSKNGKYSEEDLASIKNLQDLISKKKYAKSALAFLTDSLVQIEQLDKQLNRLKTADVREDSDLGKIRKTSSILRNIKEFSDAYAPIIQDMMSIGAMQKRGDIDLSEEDAEAISNRAADIFKIINDVASNYKELRFNTVYNFLKLYWGEDKIIDSGKDKGKRVTLEMLMEMAQKDINGLDRWISSLSDASDPLLSVIDKSVKVSHANRDRILEDVLADLRGVHTKLKDAGFGTDFMYERDKNGKLTGRIISDIDFIRFNEERQQYIDELKKEGHEYYVIKSKVEAWERKRTEAVLIDAETGRKEILPAKSLYGTNTLSKLAPAQREYYDAMIKTKSFLDSLLPSRYVSTYNAVQIRNDIVEAVADNITDPKKAAKLVISNLKDKFVRRSDDTEFGERLDKEQKVMLDFSGNPVEKLPVYYTRQLEDLDRLSTDFTSSILAYAGMSINYHEMNKVVDVLELARDLVKDRQVQQVSGDAKLVEAFKVVHKKFSKAYTKPGERTNIGDRLDDYYASVLYGKSKRDEGTVNIFGLEVEAAKLLDEVKNYTGAVGLGLNLFSAISNVTMGKMQIFIEGVGGEYFNLKDSAIGKKNYYALLPHYLGQLNATYKTDKMSLLIDKFDALEEFYGSLRSKGYYQSAISRIMGEANLFILNNMGEHYLHTRTMLSMLNAYKVKNNVGREISLFEAFEVEKKGKVGRLKIKDGVTKLDGSPITEADITDLKLKIGKVNQSLNGAFNSEDKGAIHRYALGRLAMQFRQWMPAHYYRRLAKPYYDAQLDQWREGYYRTLGRFSINLIRDLKRAKFELGTRWNELSQHEKANIRRSGAELAMFAILTSIIGLMASAKDMKGNWWERMALYQLKRLKLEVGASIPIAPDFTSNLMTILQSPSASINSFNNIMNLVEFWNMGNELESGRYKGWTEYERDLVNVFPIYGQIRKLIDIGDEDYMFNIFNQ